MCSASASAAEGGNKALLIGGDGPGSGVNLPLKGVGGKQLNWVSESAKEPSGFPAPVWVGGWVGARGRPASGKTIRCAYKISPVINS